MNRSKFISALLLTAAGTTLKSKTFANSEKPFKNVVDDELELKTPGNEKMQICIFSKQLQWMNYKDMANAVAEMGFDGIDLTVRADGHVLPERVENDLPKAVEAANKAGIKIMMISTDINDADESKTERIIKTAVAHDIHYYRTNGINYQKDLDIPANIEIIRKKFAGIARINKQYGIHSDYLNHSGQGFGASIWDLWLTIKDLDPRFIGSQYDIKHSTIAGPYSWPICFNLIHDYVKTIVIRDFTWKKNGASWEVEPVPIGQGIVDFKKYFRLVKQYQVRGPISVMCDYELGGAENGARSLTIPGKNVLDAMKKDLQSLKRILKSNEIV